MLLIQKYLNNYLLKIIIYLHLKVNSILFCKLNYNRKQAENLFYLNSLYLSSVFCYLITFVSAEAFKTCLVPFCTLSIGFLSFPNIHLKPKDNAIPFLPPFLNIACKNPPPSSIAYTNF